MFKKFNTPIKSAAILDLVLVFALSTVWAVQTYSASKVIRKGRWGWFKIIGNWTVYSEVLSHSLDSYMDEQGVNKVKITADVIEELVELPDGSSFSRLDFTLGPSGAYFDPPFELNIGGKYTDTGVEVGLYDENGEALEGVPSDWVEGRIKFYIPHFSSYYYDDYDY